jgi:hypothetical protein
MKGKHWGFFFFFSRCYNPWWDLACFTILFHNLLSLHFTLQFLTFIFFKSSSTWSSHRNLGLPTGLDEHSSHSVNFLTVLVVSILITCPAQRNLCDFIKKHWGLASVFLWAQLGNLEWAHLPGTFRDMVERGMERLSFFLSLSLSVGAL